MSGVYSCLALSLFSLVFYIIFRWAAKGDGPKVVRRFRLDVALNVLIGLIIAGLIGALLSFVMLGQ